eukprot:c28395_g1_i1 orf=156-1727(+)
MAAFAWEVGQNTFLAGTCQRGITEEPSLRVLCPPVSSCWNTGSGLKLVWTSKPSVRQDCLWKQPLVSSDRGRITCSVAMLRGEALATQENIDFKTLQNGSDIRGVAVTGVEGEPCNLTEAASEAIAAGFSEWLVERKGSERHLRISVGHDSRISAHVLQAAVLRGICRSGVDAILYGLASTPAMFNSTITRREDIFCPVDGAIMITASHLPYNRNGFKFFTSDGGLGKGDISDILTRAAQIYSHFTEDEKRSSTQATGNVVQEVNYMGHYASDLVEAVRRGVGGKEHPLEGFHIIVDAGNGAGGFFPETVLAPLGATTVGSQFLEPDGMFPNHIANPEDKEAMVAITKAVLESKADLGIIFDTDVDRAAAVDSGGHEINRNRLIALLSAIVLAEHPGTTIVTDSVTSDGLTAFIENKLGGKHHRFKRGYKNVIDEGICLNSIGQECHLAIETSGHGALKENHWLDDGAYLMVKLLVKLAAAKAAGERSDSNALTDLIKELEEAEVSVELRLKFDLNHPGISGR